MGGDVSAAGMHQLVAEDGVQRRIVVVLAVEQQAFGPEDDAHRPRQPRQHAHVRQVRFERLSPEDAALQRAPGVFQRLLYARAHRAALAPHAQPQKQHARQPPQQHGGHARQPDPAEHLQRPRPPRRRQFPQARARRGRQADGDEAVGKVRKAAAHGQDDPRYAQNDRHPDLDAKFLAPPAIVQPARALAGKEPRQAEAQAQPQREGEKAVHGVSPFCAALTPPPATIRPTRGPPACRLPSPGRARPRPAGRAA